MADQDPTRAPRRHRRAVGPPGAGPAGPEPRVEAPERPSSDREDERLLADRPPHHDRGV